MNEDSMPVSAGTDAATRYVRGQLSEEEAEAFEQFCLANPTIAQATLDDLRLKRALEGLDPQRASLPDRTGSSPRPYRLLAIAASVLILMAIAFVSWQSASRPSSIVAYRARSEFPAGMGAASLAHATLLRMRHDDVTEVAASPAARVLEIRVLSDSPLGNKEFSVQMHSESADRGRLTLDHVALDPDGYVSFYVPVQPLAGHAWVLTIAPSDGDPAERKLESFRFHLVVIDAPAA